MQNNVSHIFESQGKKIAANNYAPVELKGNDNIYWICTGKIDIFAVDQHMKRSHIARIETEEVFLGLDTKSNLSEIGIQAIGIVDTQIIQMTQQQFLDELQDEQDSQNAANAIDVWIQKLTTGIHQGRSEQSIMKVVSEKNLPVNKDIDIQARSGLTWIKMKKGSACFLKLDSYLLDPETDFIPISRHSWIHMLTDGEIETTSTFNRLSVWKKTGLELSIFNTIVLRLIEKHLTIEKQKEKIRLKNKVSKEKGAIQNALTQLSSLLISGQNIDYSAAVTPDALLTACKWIGMHMKIKIVTPPYLESDQIMSRAKLNQIARSSQIRKRQILLRGDWWKKDSGAILAHIEDSKRPVALIPTGVGQYSIADPVDLTFTPVTRDAVEQLSPFGFTLYPSFPQKSMYGADMLRFGLRDCKNDLFILILFGIIGGILSLMTPFMTGYLFDAIIPEASKHMLIYIALALVSVAITVGVLNFVKGIAYIRIESKMNKHIQSAIWDRLLSLPLSFFRSYNAGDLSNRANGINMIRQLVSGVVVTTVLASLFSIFNLALLFYYNVNLALIAIFLAVVSLIFSFIICYRGQFHQKKVAHLEGKLSGMTLQFITGISKIRVSGSEIFAFSVWSQIFGQMKAEYMKTGFLINRQEIFNMVYPLIASIVIFGTSIPYLHNQNGYVWTLGEFMAFYTAFCIFLSAILQMSLSIIATLDIFTCYERLSPILRAQPEIDLARKNPGRLKGDIEINQISFRYREGGPLILNNISIHIKPGQFVAFAGESGSGKSTLLKLLLGFEQPENGSIYYDGQNLTKLDIRDVRQQIGTVLQSGKLMPDSIFKNIVGSSGKTLDDAWEAARMAGLSRDIENMPMKMHTLVTEGGSSLSGGQRQRLMIARALVKKPSILFFDEATSALDNHTQTIVSKSLESFHSTRLVIAHRLSTIIHADCIFFVHKGQVVEQGTYSELMQLNGHFCELARRQIV
jgi:NHLM bacteriocin system ABC transporter ATP-binding protein